MLLGFIAVYGLTALIAFCLQIYGSQRLSDAHDLCPDHADIKVRLTSTNVTVVLVDFVLGSFLWPVVVLQVMMGRRPWWAPCVRCPKDTFVVVDDPRMVAW